MEARMLPRPLSWRSASTQVQAHLAALRSRLGVHNEAQAVYATWLGFRDHVAECGLTQHGDCLRNVPGVASDGPRALR